MRKWWIYQNERFPLLPNGLLIAVFAGGAVGYSALLGGGSPSWKSFIVAFISSFVSFAHLRIADEFKDFEEDRKFRPYRPVPRGLATLRELGVLAGILALMQVAVALWLDLRLLPWLLFSWTYLGLMSREFFVGEWLRTRPVLYMTSHMMIMPIVDFYATACDWVVKGETAPRGIFWFVAASFFNGMIIEIGRKIRAKEDEETGVSTYSALWGGKRAVEVWVCIMVGVYFCAAGAESLTGHFIARIALPSMIAVACLLGIWFLRDPQPGRGRLFELFSGIWTLVLYLSLGLFPFLLHKG